MGAAFAGAGAAVTLLTVTDDRQSGRTLVETQRDRLDDIDVGVSTDVIEGDDVARTIVDYAEENDFRTVIVGATTEGYLRRILFGEIPETVGEEFGGEVIMVKQYGGIRSTVRKFVQRWVGERALSKITGAAEA